ncbi:phosphoribosylanthranilate isomerase [Roseomonas sp. GC11]|uniref:phosphoribosylanthranilate isomerase n=1 Tax=Roseomonas sp. GC11 TaxID=2950546 RepID=UPI0021095352|nr:phosphoribosylanthranilate isomerase [Roseomonas sp. GC11]MCQ4162673.1 phosphoribosylanthranilate isomerase [Roseomonas sp. GC11]
MLRPQVKVCGINDAASYDAALRAGAEMVGFVFFPPSPRAVTPGQAASLIASGTAARRPLCVGLFVDATDEEIGAAVSAAPIGLLQLHGAESPERCAEIRARFSLPVMKVIGIGGEGDFARLDAYVPVVDRFLLDAKPPEGADLPGGNAVSFDWGLLAGRAIPRPWMLAGGLTPVNVAAAIRTAQAPAVDASSGLERTRGVKDPILIAAFVANAHRALEEG